ncbi:MAG: hypothetical protein AAF846_12135 [Chloroflexota bacterium]
MQLIRRLLYIPIIVLLAGCLLSIFNIMHFGVQLPISVQTVALIAGGVLGVLAVFDLRFVASPYQHPEPEEPPRTTKVIYPQDKSDPIEIEYEAIQSVEEAEEFIAKANGRVEISIDFEEEDEEV